MVDKGQMKVLTVYPDENVALWKELLFELENKWINAYDKDGVLTTERLYDLKAIPALYLLDSDKRVMAKDCTDVEYIEQPISEDSSL